MLGPPVPEIQADLRDDIVSLWYLDLCECVRGLRERRSVCTTTSRVTWVLCVKMRPRNNGRQIANLDTHVS